MYLFIHIGDSCWEPTKEGYTKADGRLVLTDGSVISDPNKKRNNDGDDETFPTDYCSECNEKYAIRGCVECGDNYCTPCYKSTHSTGTRKNHNFKLLGPIDCTECEEKLAERWCVTCDESHCDQCWRKLHSKSKRRFHPFCRVYPGGRIGVKMCTIDGQEVTTIYFFFSYYSFFISPFFNHQSLHFFQF